MGKKSATPAPSMNLSVPSKSYHPNPGALPKIPGMHGSVKHTGPSGKAYKPPTC